MIDVNIYGTLTLTRALLPAMVARRDGTHHQPVVAARPRGRARILRSTRGPRVSSCLYQVARPRGRAHGITVNAICPGGIITDMNRHLSPERQKARAAELPLRRMGTPTTSRARRCIWRRRMGDS